MPTGDIFACKLRMEFAGQQCRPGFYLIEGSGGTDPNPLRAAGIAVNDALGVTALTGFSASTKYAGVDVQDVQPAMAASQSVLLAAPLVGDIADDAPLPPQDSMLIRWITDFKGGKGKWATRSRTYVPGIYPAGQNSGFLVEAMQLTLQNFADLLGAAFVTDGTAYQMHAVHFLIGSIPRTIDTINPITSWSIDNVVAIQRSRRPGRGI